VDIKKSKQVPDSQGNAASMDMGDYVSRSGSFQYGANVPSASIDIEGAEEDNKFGVPSNIAGKPKE
jgi:hypothetical protein